MQVKRLNLKHAAVMFQETVENVHFVLGRHTKAHQECRDDRLAEIKNVGAALRGVAENVAVMVEESHKCTTATDVVASKLTGSHVGRYYGNCIRGGGPLTDTIYRSGGKTGHGR